MLHFSYYLLEESLRILTCKQRLVAGVTLSSPFFLLREPLENGSRILMENSDIPTLDLVSTICDLSHSKD